jgi:hypothetical protein
MEDDMNGAPNPLQQAFALRIIKNIDPKTGQENLEFKAQSKGMNIFETISILRGWCDFEEEKRHKQMFANMKND